MRKQTRTRSRYGAGCLRDLTSRSSGRRSSPDDSRGCSRLDSCDHMLRGAGIVALCVLLMACGESSAAQKASSSVPPVQHSWNQDLMLAGEVSGHMTGIVADVGTQTSSCTGAKPRPGQTWSNKFYGTVDASGAVWGIDFVIQNYGGPGTHDTRAVAAQLHSPDDTKGCQNTAAARKRVLPMDPSPHTTPTASFATTPHP